MGLRWCLDELLAKRGWRLDDLAARAGLTPAPWMLEPALPALLPTDVLDALCTALACEPGELIAREEEDPAAQAERALAADLGYQSFLAYARARAEAEPPSDPA